jgi:general secretion pathway protein N
MIKSGLKYLLLFLPILMVALFLTLPLKLVVEYVPIPQILKLEGLTGSVFAGQIDRLTIRKIPIHQVAYKFDISCLLRIAICLESEFLEGNVRLSYKPVVNQLDIIRGNLKLALETPGILPPSLFIKPSGIINIQEVSATIQSEKIHEISSRAIWQHAGIEGEELNLGDFEFNLDRIGPEYELTVRDLNAMIAVNGNAIVNQKGDYISTATLTAKPGLPSSIKTALEYVARKKNLNQFEVNKSGKLPPNLFSYLAFD